MPRPIHATVSIAAMRHNLSLARDRAPGRFVWAVIKADGYGHGLANAVRGLAAADGLALVEFDRASQLRRDGWSGPVLMLEGAVDGDDVAHAVRERLALVVHEARQLHWREAARAPVGTLEVHLKFNSGMNRLGFDRQGFEAAHARLASLPSVGRITLMTHFANADLPGGADAAMEQFAAATAGLRAPRCLANSAAILALPQAHADAIRPGVMLYGGTPFADRTARALGLRPAMTLASRLLTVQALAPGDTVGYGSIFRAARPMRIGVVACGYADGYPRHAPNGTPVAVDGVLTGTVGRVAMDMLMVDLEPVPQARPGTPVELWGERVPIDEVAQAAGTIGYELMCALSARVPVRVLDSGPG
ncbi:MAG: alanine racemase [Burkholderiaceae bacterium]|nr:alanine racemase [Burkholderiaceae bacterium]